MFDADVDKIMQLIRDMADDKTIREAIEAALWEAHGKGMDAAYADAER